MAKVSGTRKFKKPTVQKQSPKPKVETQVFDSKFWLKKVKGVKNQVSRVMKKNLTPDT